MSEETSAPPQPSAEEVAAAKTARTLAVAASAKPKASKGTPPPVNTVEFWTIYDLATGKIRVSGHGPEGTGALQEKSASEGLLLERTLPSSHRVNIDLPEHTAEAV